MTPSLLNDPLSSYLSAVWVQLAKSVASESSQRNTRQLHLFIRKVKHCETQGFCTPSNANQFLILAQRFQTFLKGDLSFFFQCNIVTF